tara:strand:- start:1421 stop:1717 length:297 start_codon:yes stop_codon:yes gene_type:complete
MAQWLREMSVGEWFESNGDQFEIVGLDAKAEVVLIQHFNGDLDEMDFDSWLELNAQPCSPPEDYSGALDIERDEYNDMDYGGHMGDPMMDLNLMLDDL